MRWSERIYYGTVFENWCYSSSNLEITVIDIDDFDDDVKKVIDDNFVSICEGTSDSELLVVKKYVVDLFASKNTKWIMGATAEFFVHLYMKLLGFKQECLFLNSEEGSIDTIL